MQNIFLFLALISFFVCCWKVAGRTELGIKRSLVPGIGLSIRLSTSFIIIRILYENEIVGVDPYTAIMAATIAFKFIVPLLFARLLVRCNVDGD